MTLLRLICVVVLLGCNTEDVKRCHAKGGVYISVYKSRDICLKREAVLEYDE